MKKLKLNFIGILFIMCCTNLLGVTKAWEEHGKLQVSADKRLLQHEDGSDFFWLGDTAWQLIMRLKQSDAEFYLQSRADQGFNVIQMAVEHWGNAYGKLAFNNNWDITSPNEVYWQYMDEVITSAAEKGLYVALLPNWNGRDLTNEADARVYGSWLANRYKNRPNIIWVLGGDCDASKDNKQAIWNAFAYAMRSVIGSNQLMTYHPSGGKSSSSWFNNESWLDFNMLQSGHGVDAAGARDLLVSVYNMTPTRPVLDGEPCYETILKNFYLPNPGPRYTEVEVRNVAYTQLFSGACSHTYGHHSIWQFHKDGDTWCCGTGTMNWVTALNDEGGTQMPYVANLLKSRPMTGRTPDQSIIASGSGIALRGNGYLFVYLANGGNVVINFGKISGNKVTAWWYNPRTGAATAINNGQQYDNSGQTSFTAPDNQDWVLVIDDVSKSYSIPGTIGGGAIDYTPPVITLNGSASMTITVGDDFVDPGAYAVDDVDGNLSVTTTGNVDNNTVGTYTLTYQAIDSAGNSASVTRTIIVKTANAQDGNLIDGSFEDGFGMDKTWDVSQGSPILDTNIVYAGTQSVKFVKPDSSETSGSIITLNDYIAVTPGKPYLLSAWVKGDNIQVGTEGWHKFFATGRWYDANKNVISGLYPDLFFPTGTYDWQQVTKTITAPANAAYYRFTSIGIQKTATGTAWLDELSFIDNDLVQDDLLGNAIADSSFENGFSVNKTWDSSRGNPILDTNIVYAGTQSVKFVKLDSSEASESIITLNNYLTVTPGKSYLLSAWVKGDNIQVGTEGWHKFFATGRWYDANKNPIPSIYPDFVFPTGSYDWQQVTKTITAPANAAYYRLSSIGIQKTATGTAWLDNISFSENRITDSSLEAGFAANKTWDIVRGNPVIDTDIVYDGTQAVKFIKSDSSEDSESIITLNNYIKVTPGKSYLVSGWVKGDNIQIGTEGWHKFFATGRWYDANKNAISGLYPDLTFPTGSYDWQHITKTITAPANAVYYRLSSIGIQRSATGTAWLDQVEFYYFEP